MTKKTAEKQNTSRSHSSYKLDIFSCHVIRAAGLIIFQHRYYLLDLSKSDHIILLRLNIINLSGYQKESSYQILQITNNIDASKRIVLNKIRDNCQSAKVLILILIEYHSYGI